MDKKSLVFSTVALSAVMLSASIGVTSDVQAAERPAVTRTYEYYNAEYENCYDDDGYYIGVRYPSSDNPSAIYDESGNIIGSTDMYKYKGKGKPSNKHTDNSYSYTSDDTISKVSDDIRYVNCDDPVVTSYKESVTVKKGESLSISDLNIKVGNMTDYYAYFISNGETSVIYSEGGTFTERVAVRSNSCGLTVIRVNVSVVVEQAPDLIGVHNVKGQRIYWAKNSGFTNYIADLNFDPREDPDWDNRLYKPEKLILLGVKAKDCDGNDITKNIKISGFNKKKYNKKQKVTLSVTDSEGRTTTATCSVYIKDPVKKMDKYMYNAYGGMYSDTFTNTYWLGMKAKDASTWDIEFFKWMEKVHVVGRHENGEWLVEKNGKTYFLDRLSETYTDMPKHIYSYIYSSYLDVECTVIESYGNKKVGGLGYNRFERDPNSKYFGCTDKSIYTFDKNTVECCSMTVAYIRNVLEGNRPIDKGRRDWFTMEDRGYVKDIYNPSNTTRLFCDDYLPLCIERGEIKINKETARAFGVPIKHLKKMKTYLSDPVGLKIGLGSKPSDVKYIYDRNGKYTKYNW